MKVFVRADDGEIFSLNEDGKTYSLHQMKIDFPDNLHMQYTRKQLSSVAFEEKYMPL